MKIKDFKQVPDFAALEQEILEFWDRDHTFQKSVDQRSDENAFSFYDGPPFATGLPHYGHLMQSTIKDLIPRYQTMRGKKVRRVWGWDCHGLPVENIIEKKLNLDSKKDIEKYGVDQFNEACRQTVLTYAKEWQTVIHRIGRWVDMDHAYKTMDKEFMETVWWVFRQLWDKGLIYKSHKSMHICPRCETPLSNFEVTQGYKIVKDISVFVKFQLDSTATKLKFQTDEMVYAVAWTTTAWTLPGNVLLAVGADLDYVLLKVEGETGLFVVAKERLNETMAMAEKKFQIIGKSFKGSELVGLTYKPVFPYFAHWPKAFRVVAASFVSTQEGTGIVHIAPAFGEDDYQIGQTEGIELLQHVGMNGRFTQEVVDFADMQVKPKDNPQATDIEIIKYLAAHQTLFAKKKIEHSYPHCWRCDTPLLNYATSSWYVKVSAFKDQLLANNEKINWQPAHIKHGRFGKWLEGARDWAISRNRYWGTPLPVWESDQGDFICVGSVAELENFAAQKINDLHKHTVDKIEFQKDGKNYHRIPEVLDCWFESGSMPYGELHYPFANQNLFAKSFPADFISEGQDQTRGWFYTLHVLATALTLNSKKETAAAKNIMCTGLIMASDGKKMSKRLKNYPEPNVILERYGADALRLYLMSSPAVKAETLNFVEQDVANLRRKVFVIWWNILAFYKTFACEEAGFFDLKSDQLPSNLLDRWILSRLESLIKEFQQHLDSYDVMKASRLLAPFIDELSTWYLRLSRSRLKAKDNQEVSQVFASVLYESAKVFAPVVPFFTEIIHHNMIDESSSIHLQAFPEYKEQFFNQNLETAMSVTCKIVELGHSLRRERHFKARQPLASLKISGYAALNYQNELTELIKMELNVKQVEWLDQTGDLKVDYDFNLTDELKVEGEARELIRQIQDMRKAAFLDVNKIVELELPTWPAAFKQEIEEKTNTKIKQGPSKKLLID
ncbi:MAG TPA: isoleucine--tRNA ligase [Candidatus Woesebacteria bacterium]|nr:isoleucine--tRNA ligase [Candidatus Woesebacteria bacterium]